MGELLPRLSTLTALVLNNAEQQAPKKANSVCLLSYHLSYPSNGSEVGISREIPILCACLAAFFPSAVPSTATSEKARLLHYSLQVRRFISVALFRGSPLADVISYRAL